MGSCSRAGTEAMLIEEILARYPFLFYHAVGSKYYGPIEIYVGGPRLPEMQSILTILEVDGKAGNRQSPLVRYLSR